MEERLQKILARAGVASRRAAEGLITAGRVRVNGRLVRELGVKADPRRDKVEVDGQRLVAERLVYVVLHKPRLVVSTMSDPEGRPTVAELVRSASVRLYPVGRLDFHTSGTLLLTNDGEFSQGLLHPREGVPKTYVVKVQGVPTEATLKRWRTGVELDDGKTKPCDVRLLREEAGKGWLEVTLTEGRNQQIRRMGEATGHPVMRLARLSFAGVTSEGLRPGEWRPLSYDELTELKGRYGVPRRVRSANDEIVAPSRAPRSRAPGGFGERRPVRRRSGPSPTFDEGGERGHEGVSSRHDGDRGPMRPRAGGRGRDDGQRAEGAGGRLRPNERGGPREYSRPGSRQRPDERPRFSDRQRPDERPRLSNRQRPDERPRFGERSGFDERQRSGERPRFGERGRPGEGAGFGERKRPGERAGFGERSGPNEREASGGRVRPGRREGGEEQRPGRRGAGGRPGDAGERQGGAARAPRGRLSEGAGERAPSRRPFEGGGDGEPPRRQKSSAAVPSAKGQASKGTKSRSPSRASRPR